MNTACSVPLWTIRSLGFLIFCLRLEIPSAVVPEKSIHYIFKTVEIFADCTFMHSILYTIQRSDILEAFI